MKYKILRHVNVRFHVLLALHPQAPEILACPDKIRPEQNKGLEGIAYGTKVGLWQQ